MGDLLDPVAHQKCIAKNEKIIREIKYIRYNIYESEDIKMEGKIIEITKVSSDYKCLLCCKNQATIKMKINRHRNDCVISFNVCNECLAQMQKEIETCE